MTSKKVVAASLKLTLWRCIFSFAFLVFQSKHRYLMHEHCVAVRAWYLENFYVSYSGEWPTNMGGGRKNSCQAPTAS